MSPELGSYRIVHFATHGLLNNSNPELSGIVLSLVDEAGRPQDGFLRLHDIYNLKLGADLVVLSACQTALGRDIRGEGLVGLTRGFMYAGAPRVLASLWNVDDRATAELMKQLYVAVLKDGQSPAAALRAAQVSMWKTRRWQSPVRLGRLRPARRVEVRSDHKGYGLTPAAFDKLLASLDPDRERAGERYEEIRRGLVCLFEWRGAPDPADHADETLNRVARKLDEGTEVADPFSYVYGVARLVLLEAYKSREKERAVIAQLPARSPLQLDPDDTLRFDCLERCLDELPHESRDFLTVYYQGDKRVKIENRQRLADRLRIPLNALRLRARRAREKLEMCVETCVNRRSTARV